MENLKLKKKLLTRIGQSKPRMNLCDISNKFIYSKEEEITSRSKCDYSDSEYFESGIVSRAQSPSQRSPLLQNETEALVKLSRVTESDNFSEISLGSNRVFTNGKIITNTSSFNNEDESTFIPDQNTGKICDLNFLPVIGCIETTVYCSNCKRYVHSKIDFLIEEIHSRFLKFLINVLPFCRMPDWATQNIIHKCSRCDTILARGRVNE